MKFSKSAAPKVVNSAPSLRWPHLVQPIVEQLAEKVEASGCAYREKISNLNERTAIKTRVNVEKQHAETQESQPRDDELSHVSQIQYLDSKTLTSLCQDHMKFSKSAAATVVTSSPSLRWPHFVQPIIEQMAEKVEALGCAYREKNSNFNERMTIKTLADVEKQSAEIQESQPRDDEAFDVLWKFVIDSVTNVEQNFDNTSICRLRDNIVIGPPPDFLDDMDTLFD